MLKVSSTEGREKAEKGQFFTMGDCFRFPAFSRWLEFIPPDTVFVEPFAGSNNIPKMLPKLNFKSFDIHPQERGVEYNDSIISFPKGFKATITNPPYLAKNSAARSGLDMTYFTDKHDDLYKECLDAMLGECDFVCVIIPESFITSTYDKSRLLSVISLTEKMFEDTDCPVCLAMFGPRATDDFEIYQNDVFLGTYKKLSQHRLVFNKTLNIKMNDPNGILGVYSLDSTREGGTIMFVPGEDIPSETIKVSSRAFSRISCEGIDTSNVDELIESLNYVLKQYRRDTKDVFMTAAKGLRKDNLYRRRLSWDEVKALIEKVIKG